MKIIKESGPTKGEGNSLKVGRSFANDATKAKVKILNVYATISPYDYKAECYIEYEYNVEGRTGTEVNEVNYFVKLLKEQELLKF
jgi:hypothetical protein